MLYYREYIFKYEYYGEKGFFNIPPQVHVLYLPDYNSRQRKNKQNSRLSSLRPNTHLSSFHSLSEWQHLASFSNYLKGPVLCIHFWAFI